MPDRSDEGEVVTERLYSVCMFCKAGVCADCMLSWERTSFSNPTMFLRYHCNCQHDPRPQPAPLDVEELKRRLPNNLGYTGPADHRWDSLWFALAQLAASKGASLDEIVAAALGVW